MRLSHFFIERPVSPIGSLGSGAEDIAAIEHPSCLRPLLRVLRKSRLQARRSEIEEGSFSRSSPWPEIDETGPRCRLELSKC